MLTVRPGMRASDSTCIIGWGSKKHATPTRIETSLMQLLGTKYDIVCCDTPRMTTNHLAREGTASRLFTTALVSSRSSAGTCIFPVAGFHSATDREHLKSMSRRYPETTTIQPHWLFGLPSHKSLRYVCVPNHNAFQTICSRMYLLDSYASHVSKTS